jgi:hypothetical protein
MSQNHSADEQGELYEDVSGDVKGTLGIMFMFAVVLAALVIFLYWKFTCWVAKRTNVDSCLTMFIVALLADGLLLRGNTGLAMLVLAILRMNIGSILGSPRVSNEEFKAINTGTAVTQPTTQE